ncbi:MAG: hypothetical protein C4518_19060 [Desulfobacteraceae bacterium]|nr:MAG: hypothetical protein C4518_19060 [Desulfobacteraceae bacterium]
MIVFKIKPLKLFKRPLAEQSSRGAISVEYALCMVLTAILMIGVERLFRNMAIDVLHLFIDMVLQFPNI